MEQARTERGGLAERKLIVGALAVCLAGVDLTEKRLDATQLIDYHQRSANLADVFTLIGLSALIISVCIVLVVHRERLLPPRAWERALWRKLRGLR